MAQSPEYSDLKWVEPKSWTNANRSSVQLVVIHTTEGSAHSASAEDGAAYDARRTDGTSTHYFHDNTSTVQCVRTNDQAHTARAQGNRRGIHHELCGKAGWDNEWQGTYAQDMLERAAKQAARDAKKWDIPVRHLTVAQVRDGVKGFCGHWDITRAFPADGGTHTDPGPDFPWTQFLTKVRAYLAPQPPKDEETDVALSQEDKQDIANLVLAGLTAKLETASGPAADDAIVRNLIRIPWQYPGALESLNQIKEIREAVARIEAGTETPPATPPVATGTKTQPAT